jgi:hypothetical protein
MDNTTITPKYTKAYETDPLLFVQVTFTTCAAKFEQTRLLQLEAGVSWYQIIAKAQAYVQWSFFTALKAGF